MLTYSVWAFRMCGEQMYTKAGCDTDPQSVSSGCPAGTCNVFVRERLFSILQQQDKNWTYEDGKS